MSELWRIRVRTAELNDDVFVNLPVGATVSELADALDLSPDEITIDGEVASAHRSLTSTGARNGSTVAQLVGDDESAPDSGPAPNGLVTLDQVAGLSGVGSTSLAKGRYDFTPASGSPTTDYRVSDINFTLDVASSGAVTVVPRGRPIVVDDVLITEPRTLGDDVLNVGSARFMAHPDSSLEARVTSGVAPRSIVSTNRMMPTPHRPERVVRPLSMTWLALAPLAVVFGVMGLFIHWLFFIAAIPILGLAAWYVVSHMRSERRAQLRQHIETEGLIRDFEQRVRAERRSLAGSLRAAHPSIPEIHRTVNSTDPDNPDVWKAEVGDHDFGLVSLGLGDMSWKIQTEVVDPLPEVQAIIHRNGVLPSVPIVADVADGTIGIAGDRSSALSCARALIATLAAQSAADSLRIALCAEHDRVADWDWIKWLPQTQVGPNLATTATEADRLVSSWRTPGHEWLQVVVVDQAEWARDEKSLLWTVGREPGKQVLIVLADHLHRLPDCATTVDIAIDGTATVRVGTTTHRFVTPAGASAAVAEDIACGLARCGRRERDAGLEADGEQTWVPFKLAKSRPDPVLRSRIDSDRAESDGEAESIEDESIEDESIEAEAAQLVPPPIPQSAQTPTVDLTDSRTIDLDTPAPETVAPADPDQVLPIDLRKRMDALADAADTTNVDDGHDLFP